MRHIGIFGPPGSGKSATFLMSFIRDWAKTGSVIVLDPKGELYAQTAAEYKTVYRLDLQDPTFSNPWNFVPHCKGNAEFAHEVASIIIGLDETRHASDSEKFWQVSEIAALTAILLHLPQVEKYPIPARINEFIATRDLDPNPAMPESLTMGQEMMESSDPQVRLYWGTFAKAKRELQGSILTGVSVKCAPFCTPNVRRITECPPNLRSTGIELGMLREPGSAIYVVVPEGDASRYSTFLATFFGLAMNTLRKLPVERDTPPALFVFDEAGNIPIHGLKEMLGVGRGRRVGLVLGYQNLSQVHAQYGEHGGDAILGSIGTMIFLPGLDDKTARYAAGRVGKTTVLQRTSVDATGTKYDNERHAEHIRDLLDHSELRQLVRHTQAVAIIDNVPPIKFRFPPFALRARVTEPARSLLHEQTVSKELTNG
jgi:type IV secretory pathway TraG/TraD family ATPase VirD4